MKTDFTGLEDQAMTQALQALSVQSLAALLSRALSDEDLAALAEELGVLTQAVSRENERLRAGMEPHNA